MLDPSTTKLNAISARVKKLLACSFMRYEGDVIPTFSGKVITLTFNNDYYVGSERSIQKIINEELGTEWQIVYGIRKQQNEVVHTAETEEPDRTEPIQDSGQREEKEPVKDEIKAGEKQELKRRLQGNKKGFASIPKKVIENDRLKSLLELHLFWEVNCLDNERDVLLASDIPARRGIPIEPTTVSTNPVVRHTPK